MKKILSAQIIGLINEIILEVDYTEPLKARKYYNTLNYITVLVLNYFELESILEVPDLEYDIDVIIKKMFEIGFITSQEWEYCNKFIKEKENVMPKLSHLLHQNKDLSSKDYYDEILIMDLTVIDNHYCVIEENKARDRAGAYYTSNEFAKVITKKVLDSYLYEKLGLQPDSDVEILKEQRNRVFDLLCQTKFVDLSCGTGSFVLAVVDYVQNIFNDDILTSKVISNLYGFDIDPIAIQIVKVLLINSSKDMGLTHVISKNFVLGNPLLNAEDVDYGQKFELILSGFIYNNKLGVNQEQYVEHFDVVLGNPPWEKIRFEDKNFFSNYYPEIARINKSNERKIRIQELINTNPNLKNYYEDFTEGIESAKKQIKSNEILQKSSIGELNTNNLFTELAVRFIRKGGIIGLIIKSALINTAANKEIFNYLLDEKLIFSIDDYINRNKIFPIDSRERFSVIILKKYAHEKFKLSMMQTEITDINNNNSVYMDKKILSTINPLNCMVPNISDKEDLVLLLKFYSKYKTFDLEYPNCKYGRLVHLTNHAEFIQKDSDTDVVPIYEGKFIDNYDNKYSTFAGMDESTCYAAKASARIMSIEEKEFSYPKSRYYIKNSKWTEITKKYLHQYSVVWRSLTSATNNRTTIASILPHCPTIQSIQFLQYDDDVDTLLIILALFNSIVFDYLVKLKLSGIDLTQTVIKQIPVPNESEFNVVIDFLGVNESIKKHVFVRIAKLYKNDERLHELFKDIYLENKVYYSEISEERTQIMLEIDCLIGLVYSLDKEEFIYILSKFEKNYNIRDAVRIVEQVWKD